MKLDQKKIETICSLIQLRAQINSVDIYSIPEENLDLLIINELDSISLKLDDEDYLRLKKECESQFFIRHKEGVCIVDDYDEPYDWYTEKREKEDLVEYFWKRYKNYLIQNGKLDISSINQLEYNTLDLMNHLGNPENASPFFKRGLVIGDVQSGKTSAYIGLICKAADSGYRIVILLTGITETLRAQTQKRMEEGIIGFSITGQKDRLNGAVRKRVGVGSDGGPIKVTAMTSIEYDFIGSVDRVITTSLESNRLIIFIVKKNTKVLNRLYHWLYDINVDRSDGKIHYPMLMIDDEADNASINTNKEEDDPTKTNEIIRRIANGFTQTTYVGFTATPYANVFINPDSKEEMINDDLFPKNFIHVLPAPSNYVGATHIFGKDSKYKKSLVWIHDIQEPDELSNPEEFDSLNSFYYKHKKEWSGILPKSLNTSIYCFFLANVVRDLRGDSQSPRTMMVNITRFVKVQKYIQEYIELLFNEVFNEIRVDFSEIDLNNRKIKLYQDLKTCWEEYFSNIDFSWEEIGKKSNLFNAIKDIQVLVVNSGKNTGKLDYEKNPHLRAIAVGGLALSRGLTLEGLITSYFYRNTSTFDVLMQMGRWFGYRKNYEDLFRIWTSKKSADWYNEIAENTEDLKRDITRMRDAKLTPEDFGLRVRNDSDELKITAPNKMRNAADHIEQISYWGKVFDTPYLDTDLDNNLHNLRISKQFIEELSAGGFAFKKEVKAKDLYFSGNIPSIYISTYLKNLSISAHNIHFDTKQILDFLGNCDESILKNWDVVLLEGDRKNEKYNIDNKGIEIVPVERSFDVKKNRINISGRSGRLGSPTDARCGLNKDQIDSAINKAKINKDGIGINTINQEVWFKYVENRNPLLMIYYIKLKSDGPDEVSLEKKSLIKDLSEVPVMGFSVGFPMNQHSHAAEYHKYKVNVIYNKQEIEEYLAESIEE
jgi:hypothetical protein